MAVVLDSSALLAYLREEPGAEVLDGLLVDARMASVNWAEVVQKSLSAGVNVVGMWGICKPWGYVSSPSCQSMMKRQGGCGRSHDSRACVSLG